jgi:alkylation response protein AidB-like acyl-CoA dehydrogenase
LNNGEAATASELIERVRALSPLVDKHRSRIDRERGMPDEITAELIEAQLLRLWTPRDLGGLELDPIYDEDREQAREARRRICELAIETDALVTGPHFPALTLGHIRREGPGYRFEIVEPPPVRSA